MVNFVALLGLSLLWASHCVHGSTPRPHEHRTRVAVEGRLVCKIDHLVKLPPTPPATLSLLWGDGFLNKVIGNSTANRPTGDTFKVSGHYKCDECYKSVLSLRIVHYCPDAQQHFKTIRDVRKEAVQSSGEGEGDQDSERIYLGDVLLDP